MFRIPKTFVVVTLLVGLIFSGFYFPFENIDNGNVKANLKEYVEDGRLIEFYGQKEKYDESLKKLVNETTDDSIFASQKGLKKEKVKIKIKEIKDFNKLKIGKSVDTIALPYTALLESSNAKNEAQRALQDGIKIYLYHEIGLSLKNYKEILAIEEFVSKDKDLNGQQYEFSIYDGEFEEKGVQQNNSEGEIYQVIGYSPKHVENSQFNVYGFSQGDEQPVSVSEVDLLNAVLQQEIASFNKNSESPTWQENDEVAEEKDKKISLNPFPEQKALAASTAVKSAATACREVKNNTGRSLGKVCTDFDLYQDFNETMTNFDRFTIKEMSQIWRLNEGNTTKFYTNHDIPYDSDEFESSGPVTRSNGFNWSFTVPWSLNVSFSNDDALDVTRSASIDWDYSRWTVTDGWGSYMENGFLFHPSTAWRSSGSYAIMDIDNKGTFYEVFFGNTVSGGLHIDVNFDYPYPNTDTDRYYP